jgi:hypothetical protein
MNQRRNHLAVCGIMLFFVIAACSLSSKSTPSAANTPIPAESTSAPTMSAPTTAPATTAPLSASGGCANPYYPVVSGANWTYSSTGGGNGDYTYSRKLILVSDKGFSTSYLYSTGVNSTIAWTCQDGNLAALDTGVDSFNMTTSKIKMTSNSVTADGYFIPASFSSGNPWAEKLTIAGTVVETGATKSIDAQITVQFNCSDAGAEKITVPAGKFDTEKATCTKNTIVSAIVNGKTMQLAANQENINYWYAKGVGFVQSVATGGSNNETVVLLKYKIP